MVNKISSSTVYFSNMTEGGADVVLEIADSQIALAFDPDDDSTEARKIRKFIALRYIMFVKPKQKYGITWDRLLPLMLKIEPIRTQPKRVRRKKATLSET